MLRETRHTFCGFPCQCLVLCGKLLKFLEQLRTDRID